MEFFSGSYTKLELFLRPRDGEDAVIQLWRGETLCARETVPGTVYAGSLRFSLERDSVYRLDTAGVPAALCYLCGGADLYRDGVAFLDPDGSVTGRARLAARYDRPNREQAHFTPPCGWLNDPNGLCRFGGYYHLYYQLNPFSQEWDNMYWGHAASRDLVHWVHLPVALSPQEEILRDTRLKGGAFSGSAVVLDENRVRFYFTRHAGAQGEPPTEYQVFSGSADGLELDAERLALPVQGEPVAADCRDPKVLLQDGAWSMVLGSKWAGTPAILYADSPDGERFTVRGPLLTDPEQGEDPIECPDLFELQGKWVAVAALMNHQDAQGRRSVTRYYIGDVRDGRMAVERTGLYDFGSNFYAVQSFQDGGRRLAFGWINDIYGEHTPAPDGVMGSMSLPRELFLRDGTLWMRPAAEVYALRGRTLYHGQGRDVALSGAGRNCYWARVELSGETDFELLLAQDGPRSLTLRRQGGETGFAVRGTTAEDVRFPAPVEQVSSVEVFLDRRVCEVFLNDGQAAGAKLFDCGDTPGVFRACFAHPERVRLVEVCELRSCWEI